MSALEVVTPVLREPRKPMRLERILLDAPRRGEVRVRLAASGVCHSCLHAADGSHTVPLPIVLGDEGAGVVEALGEGCDSLEVGAHVVVSWAPGCRACPSCLRGYPARCSRQPPFGYADAESTRFHDPAGAEVFHYGPATYSPAIVVPESAAVPIRHDVPLETAALIGCCVATGVGAVVRTASVALGQSVAVFGCGGVGLNVVQAAALVGAAPIIAVDLRARKLELARELGATHAVDASRADPVEAIRALSGGGCDYAFAVVGVTRAIEQAVESLAPGGAAILIGAPPHGERLSLDPGALRGGERRILGCAYGSLNPPRDFPWLVDLYTAGKLRLDDLITRRYEPAQSNEAFAALAAGDDARGLIVF